MEPTEFGDPPLFALYHSPDAAGRGQDVGVLVCPPIGHEHTRSHRALKVLSEALARAGFHVLRFDYRGLGDSSGELGDGTVDHWCDDIGAALRELQGLSGARELALVGLRVGATLAARALSGLAATRTRPRVRQLILWDPVCSGAAFLGLARRFQHAFLDDPGRFPRGARAQERAGEGSDTEALLGYSYSPRLRESLHELDLLRIDPWPSVATSLVLSEASPGTDELRERLRTAGRLAGYEVLSGPEAAWEDYARHEDTFRPGLAVRAVLSMLDGGGR